MCRFFGCFFLLFDFCWIDRVISYVFLNCLFCYEEYKMIVFEIYNINVIYSGFVEIVFINNIY